MKKWALFAIVGLGLLLGSLYLFIPNVIDLHQEVSLAANRQGMQRRLFDEKTWPSWWPEKTTSTEAGKVSKFNFNGNTYMVKDKTTSSVLITT
ncbi:MAG: hypothetical protein H7Y42_18805, partial [Chitinophagaceae bacterium]|nr:hypothetical protein [Chitinophagaceae bacterium]